MTGHSNLITFFFFLHSYAYTGFSLFSLSFFSYITLKWTSRHFIIGPLLTYREIATEWLLSQWVLLIRMDG